MEGRKRVKKEERKGERWRGKKENERKSTFGLMEGLEKEKA